MRQISPSPLFTRTNFSVCVHSNGPKPARSKATKGPVSSPQRMADFPEVPTFAEIGHSGATMMPWWGLMAPAGTPQPIVARLTQELEAATKSEPVRERLKATFVQIDFAGPQEFARRLEAETTLYGEIKLE